LSKHPVGPVAEGLGQSDRERRMPVTERGRRRLWGLSSRRYALSRLFVEEIRSDEMMCSGDVRRVDPLTA
jgi:hypothetical protein